MDGIGPRSGAERSRYSIPLSLVDDGVSNDDVGDENDEEEGEERGDESPMLNGRSSEGVGWSRLVLLRLGLCARSQRGTSLFVE